jgi:manganese/zinc/iron transport system permease protein
MSDLLRFILLQDYNTRVVALGCVVLGGACGALGTFTMLRGRALIADTLSHAALPGVCAAFLLLGTRSLPFLLLGALVFGVLGVLSVTWVRKATPVKEDAALAITLSVFFGLGICLLISVQHDPRGAHAGLEGFIFGKAASMVRADVITACTVAASVMLTLLAGWKRFSILCFDRHFGDAAGLRMGATDLLLMALVCVCTVAALPAVGLVMAVALLTIPPAAARFWTDRLSVMCALSAAFGAFAGFVGAGASAMATDLSTGPVIVLACAAIFGVSMLIAPRRGVLATWWLRLRRRREMARQNLLRAMYELEEVAADRGAGGVTIDALALKRSWSLASLEALLATAAARGQVSETRPQVAPLATSGRAFTLTPSGRAEAARLVRAHRLWELFLIEQARIAPDHVDRDADAIEHVLPEHVIADLERQLIAEGRLPRELLSTGAIPGSPHPIERAGSAGESA